MDHVWGAQRGCLRPSTGQQLQQVGEARGLQVLHGMLADGRGTRQSATLLSRHHHLTQSTDLSLHQVTAVSDHGGCECLIPDIGDTDLSCLIIFRYGEPALRIGHGERLPFPGIMDGGSDDGFLCILVKYDGL